MKITGSWIVTQHVSVDRYQWFTGMCCIYIQHTLEMKAAGGSSKSLVPVFQTKQHCIAGR
jgi:hypothetical protein